MESGRASKQEPAMETLTPEQANIVTRHLAKHAHFDSVGNAALEPPGHRTQMMQQLADVLVAANPWLAQAENVELEEEDDEEGVAPATLIESIGGGGDAADLVPLRTSEKVADAFAEANTSGPGSHECFIAKRKHKSSKIAFRLTRTSICRNEADRESSSEL
jgi:hypothetical protein